MRPQALPPGGDAGFAGDPEVTVSGPTPLPPRDRLCFPQEVELKIYQNHIRSTKIEYQ